jgi:hypothetical protein
MESEKGKKAKVQIAVSLPVALCVVQTKKGEIQEYNDEVRWNFRERYDGDSRRRGIPLINHPHLVIPIIRGRVDSVRPHRRGEFSTAILPSMG